MYLVLLYGWDVPNKKLCWFVPCLIALLRGSQTWNTADVFPVILHCWTVPYLQSFLTSTLSCYIVEVFPILEHCCCVPCFIIWLRDSQFWNIIDLYPVSLQYWEANNFEKLLTKLCHNTLLSSSPSHENAETYLVWLLAELVPIIDPCWCIPCSLIWLRYCKSINTTFVYPVLLQ